MSIYKALKDLFHLDGESLITNAGYYILSLFISLGLIVSQEYMVLGKTTGVDTILLYFIIISCYAFSIWVTFTKLEGFFYIISLIHIALIFSTQYQYLYVVGSMMLASLIMAIIFTGIELVDDKDE